jgi:ketosteroid isomerase-like protein
MMEASQALILIGQPREVQVVGAHPNQTIARELWDAIADADPQAIHKLFSDETVWTVRGSSPRAGVHLGTDAIMEFLAEVGEGCDEMSATLIDISVSERGAVIHYSVDARRGELHLETDQLLLIRIQEAKIVSAVLAPVDQEAHDRFWSA